MSVMRKRIAVWLLAAVWCLSVVQTVFGSESIAAEASDGKRIYDYAGLLDGEYVGEAREVIEDFQDTYHLDIVVVTVDDAQGKTAVAFADDFYEEGGFGRGSDLSGILFLIDMDNRELVFSSGVRGVDRIVPLGGTMELSFIWDGYKMIETMSRYVYGG